MNQNRDFVDDLLIRARRSELSEDEQAELEHALESSLETRLLLEAGSGFDAEDSVEPGDELLIARMAREVPKRSKPRRSALRYFVQGLLVGALLTGLAVAGVETLTRHSQTRQTLETAPKPKRAPANPSRGSRAAEKPAPRAAPLPESPLEVAPPAQPAAEPTPATSTTQPLESNARAPMPSRARELSGGNTAVSPGLSAPPAPAEQTFPDAPTSAMPVTAAGLYAAGNRARVAGDFNHAVSLYRQLAQTFPQSAEANAAHLALGVLYLQQGQPSAALSELRQRRGSDAEALWTEAQALQKLGRSTEERAVLERLLHAFPSSAYVTAARRRLAEVP